MRHKWKEVTRTYGSYRTECERCDLMKDARFAYNFHWNEWKWPGEHWFTADKTPPCQKAASVIHDVLANTEAVLRIRRLPTGRKTG